MTKTKDRVREVLELIAPNGLLRNTEVSATAIVASQEKREKELRKFWEKHKENKYMTLFHFKYLWQAINNYFGGGK